jgi:hypothetical protein
MRWARRYRCAVLGLAAWPTWVSTGANVARPAYPRPAGPIREGASCIDWVGTTTTWPSRVPQLGRGT